MGKFNLKNVLVSGLCVAFCAFVLGECESTRKEGTPEDMGATGIEETNKEQEVQESQKVPETGFLFADVANLEFYFASGAGGWCTELYIHEDGTFEGLYHDSDMGDSSDEYPNGTIYYCDFTGKFTQLEKVDDYTYAMLIEHLEYADTEGDEEIADGYVISIPMLMDSIMQKNF